MGRLSPGGIKVYLTPSSRSRPLLSWHGPVGTALLLVVPLTAVLGLAHGSQLTDTLSAARSIALCVAVLVAATLLVTHGRIATNEQSEWLGVALGLPAVLALARTGPSLTRPNDLPDHAGDVLALSTAVLGLSALFVLLAARRPAVLRPLPTAVVPLVVALGGQQLLLTSPPRTGGDFTVAAALAHVVVAVLLAVLVDRLEALPVRARRHLGAGIVLAGAASALGAVSAGQDAVSAVCLALGLAGAVLILSTSLRLLRSALGLGQRELSRLHERLAATEEARRADRARLHEVTTIVAGISSASQLAHELPRDEADELRSLVGAELGRLERLLEHRRPTDVPSCVGPAAAPAYVDLDEVVGRIAATHRARGHRVEAPRCGVRVAAEADALAEILDVLVENAAQHGSADDISVLVEERPGLVEIHVRDQGPGVPEALRPHLFDWARSRPGSPGEGIGLYAADRLARRLGGGLRLEGTTTGASFALRLPREPEGSRPGGRVSHAR